MGANRQWHEKGVDQQYVSLQPELRKLKQIIKTALILCTLN